MKPRRPTLNDAIVATSAMAPVDDSFDFAGDAANEGADDDRCGVLVRVSPDLRRDLKIAAIQRGVTVQALMLEAIAAVLEKPDQAPAP
jgi:hypothetical protein